MIETHTAPVAISRHHYWIESDDSQLFTSVHTPSDGKVRPLGIVICNAVGFESVHLHRSLRRLADELAVRRFATARFDYVGCGNSSGDHSEANLVKRWIDNIVIQAKTLREQFDLIEVCLVGVRLGCVLGHEALGQIGGSKFVSWEPCEGKRFVREVRAASLLAKRPGSQDAGVLESGGFVFSDSTIESIRDLTMRGQVDREMLVVGREKGAAPEDVQDWAVEYTRTADYDGAIRTPHYTEIPLDSIAAISSWLDQRAEPPSPRTAAPLVDGMTMIGTGSGVAIRETAFKTDPSGISG